MKALASRRVRALSAASIGTALLGVAVAAGPSLLPEAHSGDVIAGPYSILLAASDNLGPSTVGDVQLTMTLATTERPLQLMEWAGTRGLAVRWKPGDPWAIVTGPADHIAAAFDVPVYDFRGQQGQLFYASPLQPALPYGLRGEAAEVNAIDNLVEGYDLGSGRGIPNVYNLVRSLLEAKQAQTRTADYPSDGG